uniref:Uncharacterized protein n=1 Tax=Chromera velia CCMP2878 TaxID=1169474 RepID=A0A0G4FDF3_9ALVE|eukprot:Cvel_3228.t1-p1 / transcript=Cvel_3228.t1 / gene=Cvel_3228 / organism=Chromera_velia_CCMP2878 / gene_product=hypothetical protein / transcript_product=hypothetical protein / location=Cvel_scaffold126:70057-71262(-) / protein_length=402 / sequence_SO=supercontig / SO=protein_coding / is_pseudo=false
MGLAESSLGHKESGTSSTSDTEKRDVCHKVCASAVLGVRLFWKLSSLSTELRVLRQKDCLKDVFSPENQVPLSERSELRSLVHDCIDRDDVTALKHLQEVNTLDLQRRFPALLRRACEKQSRRCVASLSQSASLYAPQVFSASSVEKIDKESLRTLIEQRALHPDAWFEVERGNTKYWAPLLIVMNEANNFECAEYLLEAGARTDVCEWLEEENGGRVGKPRWDQTRFCPGKTPLHSLLVKFWRAHSTHTQETHSQKLRLLHRIVAVSSASKSRCLEWTSTYSAREMCCLGLACFVSEPEAVAALLAAREIALGGKEGTRMIRLAFEGTSGWYNESKKREAEQRLIKTLKALAEKAAELSSETRRGDLLGQALNEACESEMEGVVVSLLQMGVSPKRRKAGA